MGNSFFVSSTNVSEKRIQIDAEFVLQTKDGNPTSSGGQWTREGSAAAVVFRAVKREDPLSGCYAVNIFTNDGGGVKFFVFPYRSIRIAPMVIEQSRKYHVRVVAEGKEFHISVGVDGGELKEVIRETDSSYSSGFVGLNVWQSAALFQNVFVSFG